MRVTPSAVSHQIRGLERALGIKLFTRRVRSLELTSAGQTLLDDLEPLLDGIDRAVRRVARNRAARRLKVALPPLFATELFLPRLARHAPARRSLDIEVKTLLESADTHDAGADISVILAPTKPRNLEGWRLFRQRLVGAATPAIAEELRERGRHVLREQSIIVHKTRTDAFGPWARAAGLGGVTPRGVVALDSMSAVVRAAEEGVGVALVPSRLCEPRFAAGTLARIAAAELTTDDSYFLVHTRQDGARAEVRSLASWMLSEFRG
jgi:LysR family glycine cleavage system transcriptional activator